MADPDLWEVVALRGAVLIDMAVELGVWKKLRWAASTTPRLWLIFGVSVLVFHGLGMGSLADFPSQRILLHSHWHCSVWEMGVFCWLSLLKIGVQIGRRQDLRVSDIGDWCSTWENTILIPDNSVVDIGYNDC